MHEQESVYEGPEVVASVTYAEDWNEFEDVLLKLELNINLREELGTRLVQLSKLLGVPVRDLLWDDDSQMAFILPINNAAAKVHDTIEQSVDEWEERVQEALKKPNPQLPRSERRTVNNPE